MSTRTRATVIRTELRWGRGEERPGWRSGARTTFTVTRAVLEEEIGGADVLTVYGHRAEKYQAPGYDNPGSEPLNARFEAARGIPAELHAVYHALRAPMEGESGAP